MKEGLAYRDRALSSLEMAMLEETMGRMSSRWCKTDTMERSRVLMLKMSRGQGAVDQTYCWSRNRKIEELFKMVLCKNGMQSSRNSIISSKEDETREK